VTVIVPAFNEEASIDAKIRNVLSADYPPELLDVLVVSDASTDRTDEIARGFSASGVRLIVQETRRGKTAGLNRAIGLARGEIIVFTDANAAYQPDTIRTLVRYFQDERIGLVTGYTKYSVTDTGEVAEATNAYTSLERAIKRAETAWGCCVGADGAIFAMRRALYRPLRDDDINDFVLPLSVIEQGSRCVLAEDAFCSENAGGSFESEFRRQSRITNRSLRAIRRHLFLLNPLRFPSFSFFLFSHKVMRFLSPALAIASAAALVPLAAGGGVYLWLALALAGASLFAYVFHRNRLARLMSVFVTMNVAMLHGWGKFLRGRPEVTWQHDRESSR
jgi:cellulose synthase/poly-beta-1,6-N-acetylglucosamine synthase-like glycosyltransferase